MRKVVFGLVTLFIASQFLVSCSSESEILGQFSKRKYLKKYKSKEVKYEDKVGKVDNKIAYTKSEKEEDVVIASTEEEVVVSSVIIEGNRAEDVITKTEKNTTVINDYAAWNNYNRNVNMADMPSFSKEMAVQHHSKSSVSNKRASEILIAVLCIFLPPIAVVLYEDGVTTNFWVDLVATLLFWLPGIILAFLICFAGVSF
ncbi:MAG: YqaE/Pmp3 family membrane protein [Vicingaceae bacterium]|nr:YqaE/Pmp3 family membrane protein [Vicingaceae bacterium]